MSETILTEADANALGRLLGAALDNRHVCDAILRDVSLPEGDRRYAVAQLVAHRLSSTSGPVRILTNVAES